MNLITLKTTPEMTIQLPQDILTHILSFCSYREISIFRRVSKIWMNIIDQFFTPARIYRMPTKTLKLASYLESQSASSSKDYLISDFCVSEKRKILLGIKMGFKTELSYQIKILENSNFESEENYLTGAGALKHLSFINEETLLLLIRKTDVYIIKLLKIETKKELFSKSLSLPSSLRNERHQEPKVLACKNKMANSHQILYSYESSLHSIEFPSGRHLSSELLFKANSHELFFVQEEQHIACLANSHLEEVTFFYLFDLTTLKVVNSLKIRSPLAWIYSMNFCNLQLFTSFCMDSKSQDTSVNKVHYWNLVNIENNETSLLLSKMHLDQEDSTLSATKIITFTGAAYLSLMLENNFLFVFSSSQSFICDISNFSIINRFDTHGLKFVQIVEHQIFWVTETGVINKLVF